MSSAAVPCSKAAGFGNQTLDEQAAPWVADRRPIIGAPHALQYGERSRHVVLLIFRWVRDGFPDIGRAAK
jgi:hypothetical protein